MSLAGRAYFVGVPKRAESYDLAGVVEFDNIDHVDFACLAPQREAQCKGHRGFASQGGVNRAGQSGVGLAARKPFAEELADGVATDDVGARRTPYWVFDAYVVVQQCEHRIDVVIRDTL